MAATIVQLITQKSTWNGKQVTRNDTDYQFFLDDVVYEHKKFIDGQYQISLCDLNETEQEEFAAHLISRDEDGLAFLNESDSYLEIAKLISQTILKPHQKEFNYDLIELLKQESINFYSEKMQEILDERIKKLNQQWD